MNPTDTTPHVFTAINAVQSALSKEGISKDRKNTQQGYDFRGIDDVYNTLCQLLSTHGLVILPAYGERVITERETKTGGVLFGVTVRGEFKFVSAKDGSSTTVTTYGEAMDSADKATNKAMSAAFKYACIQAFCIPTEGDNDADAHTHEPVARAAAPAPRAAAPTPAQRAAAPARAAAAPAASAPMSEVPWRDVVIHFGKQQGKALGELEMKSLEWWMAEWQPKEFRGSISPENIALRKALDRAKAELQKVPVGTNGSDEDVPF